MLHAVDPLVLTQLRIDHTFVQWLLRGIVDRPKYLNKAVEIPRVRQIMPFELRENPISQIYALATA